MRTELSAPAPASAAGSSKKTTKGDGDGFPQIARMVVHRFTRLSPGAFKDAKQKTTQRQKFEPVPEDDYEAPALTWWEQQQLFGFNDNGGGYDFGDDYDSTGPPDFPTPHL